MSDGEIVAKYLKACFEHDVKQIEEEVEKVKDIHIINAGLIVLTNYPEKRPKNKHKISINSSVKEIARASRPQYETDETIIDDICRVADYLIVHKHADVNFVLNGKSCLTNASDTGFTKMVYLLLKYNVNINHVDNEGYTALSRATRWFWHDDIIDILVEQESTHIGFDFISAIIFKGDIELFNKVISRSKMTQKELNELLYKSTSHGRIEFVKRLIELYNLNPKSSQAYEFAKLYADLQRYPKIVEIFTEIFNYFVSIEGNFEPSNLPSIEDAVPNPFKTSIPVASATTATK
jgi:hypothetical protein